MIEIVHALPEHLIARALELPSGSLVADALALAAQHPDFAGVDLENSPVGIFGRLVPKDQPLKDGDRIEIYRPLAEEPKLARRRRAVEKRSAEKRSAEKRS